MTVAECQEGAVRLRNIMNKYGVTCSIELQEGRGLDPWLFPWKPLRMQHHTATHYNGPTGNLTPALWTVKHGRSDVPGPLANGYGGFDLVYRIICMGLANHPGEGGPITIDGVFIPANSARLPTWGTEYEGGYEEWEDIPGMLEFMGRADAALAEFYGRPLSSQMEHSTWAPDRKIDRLHFTRERGIILTEQWWHVVNTMPVPQPKDAQEMLLIKRYQAEVYYLLHNGVMVYLERVNDIQELKAQLPIFEPDPETFTNMQAAWPVINA